MLPCSDEAENILTVAYLLALEATTAWLKHQVSEHYFGPSLNVTRVEKQSAVANLMHESRPV